MQLSLDQKELEDQREQKEKLVTKDLKDYEDSEVPLVSLG